MVINMRVNLKLFVLAIILGILGVLLPWFFGGINLFGTGLLPMVLPVLLCGMVCGLGYGGVVGALVPILYSLIFGTMEMYPLGAATAVELCTFGVLCGLLYKTLKQNVYVSLLLSMFSGRTIFYIVYYFMMRHEGKMYTADMFINGEVLNVLAGIAIQIIFIPLIVLILNKTGIVHKGEK